VEGRFVLDDEELVLTRIVPAEGRSRAYVNGRLATAATLAEHGESLVELHGQHAHQSLLTTAAQRDALDRFCGTDLGPLRAARAELTEIDAALAALGGDARTRAREIDLLRFQVGELVAAELDDADEDERLSRDEDVLADARGHVDASLLAVEALGGDRGAIETVAEALRAIGTRSPFDAEADRLRSVAAELDDLAAEIRRRGEMIDDDPVSLEQIRLRRAVLHDLRRKYGESLADVIEFRDETQARLAELEQYDERVAELERQRVATHRREREAAATVALARRAGASELAAAVERTLRSLALPNARVEVAVDGADPGDDVTLLLAANPGSPPLPLARVASGGELARVMLAVRLVLTESPDTMVFDEVDAGIGGATADAVGGALAELATKRQVIVVTHLAQVAARADHQLVVAKSTDGQRTTTTVASVAGSDRVDEVARMLSGRQESESARRHAAELLGRN
jgi:DNA repair protein RecN (Recombination protein N)